MISGFLLEIKAYLPLRNHPTQIELRENLNLLEFWKIFNMYGVTIYFTFKQFTVSFFGTIPNFVSSPNMSRTMISIYRNSYDQLSLFFIHTYETNRLHFGFDINLVFFPNLTIVKFKYCSSTEECLLRYNITLSRPRSEQGLFGGIETSNE